MAALRRAATIATTAGYRDHAATPAEAEALDLLTVSIYCLGQHTSVDHVQNAQLAVLLAEATQPPRTLTPEARHNGRADAVPHLTEAYLRAIWLRTHLADGLTAAGHRLDAPLETDPVVDAWQRLTTEPTAGPDYQYALDYPLMEDSTRGTSPLSRALSTARSWVARTAL